MNLNIHHRNVKMNLVFASVIAQKLYQLEDILGVTDASVTLERDTASPSQMQIRVELETGGSRIVAEGLDKTPGTALLKLMASLQRQVQRGSNPHRVRFRARTSRKPVARIHRSKAPGLSSKGS